MSAVVLDASAVLVLLRDEPGADNVAQHVGDAAISAVNVQEIVKEMLREGMELSDIDAILGELALDVHAHDGKAAFVAASLYAQTKEYGRGLGDRSCMGLGLQLALPVLTADREWRKVTIQGLELRLLR